MTTKLSLIFLMIFSVTFLQAQDIVEKEPWIGEIKAGIRIQKAQKLYWENGFTMDITSPKVLNDRLHGGLSYVSSRLGSAIGTNAIKQDNFLLHLGYYFRPEKDLKPFLQLNTGYFIADYESEIFDDLQNDAFLLSLETGLSYEFNFPVTLNLGVGYNLNNGNGNSGPGTVYPVFYQMSLYYTLFKQN